MRRALVSVLIGATVALLDAAPSRLEKPLSFAILEDYDKGTDLAEVERDFVLFNELGISTWRGSFGWDDYEPERGKYDFDWLHRFAELAARHQLVLRPYLAFTPEWAGQKGSDHDAWNDAPRRDQDWARFVRHLALALKRHPNVVSFEIYNEENVKQWWDSSPRRYAQVLAVASRAIKAVHPRAPVVFGGLVFPDQDWVERVCGLGGARAFVALPVHAYPETWAPPGVTVENYLGDFPAFASAADRACGGRKSIWINETGFATVPGTSERDQAEWWVRAMATFAATPRVEHIGVYEIKDLASDKPAIGDTPNYHLGLTYADRRRKLAFGTVKMLVALLDGRRLTLLDRELRWIDRPEDAYAHLFGRPGGDRVLIAWTKRTRARLQFPEGDISHVVEFALDGSSREIGRPEAITLVPGEPRVLRLRR